jgi:SAM-dependent methyltransferase
MTDADLEFLRKLLDASVIKSPCLELGAGVEGHTTRELIEKKQIKYFSSDMVTGQGVDFVVDFENISKVEECFNSVEKFGSILVMNVLEHTFEPIKLLDSVFTLLRPGGTCVIVAPSVWPIHNYPIDCWRINPNFYEQYCKSRNLTLMNNYFEYVGYHHVNLNMTGDKTYVLPLSSKNNFKMLFSRVIHKLFNTYGRSMSFASHIATGVVIKKQANEINN